MRALQCPECSLSMQVFFAAVKPEGSRVELDRCPRCQRLWFDVGELERAVGRRFLPRLAGGPALHPCPNCRGPMRYKLVGGEVTIEECDRCVGALLDAHELQVLKGEGLQEVKAAPPPPPPSKRVAPPPPKRAAVSPPPPPPKRAAKQAPARAEAPKAATLKVIEYDCERCGAPTAMGTGGQVNSAWVCRDCELREWPDQPSWADPERAPDLIDMLGDMLATLFPKP